MFVYIQITKQVHDVQLPDVHLQDTQLPRLSATKTLSYQDFQLSRLPATKTFSYQFF